MVKNIYWPVREGASNNNFNPKRVTVFLQTFPFSHISTKNINFIQKGELSPHLHAILV